MNVSKKAVAVAKETSTNAGGEGDFIRCVSAFCVATTASTPFKGDLLVMDIIIPDDAACNASCSTLLSTKSSGSTTNTPSGSAKMTEGWQMVTSSSNIFATTKPSDSAIGIASTADAATGNSNSNSAVVTEEVNISDIYRNTHASAADNGNSTASSSANDISDDATNWSSELQTLSDMGFNDLQMLIPLLKQHVQISKSTLQEAGVPESSGGNNNNNYPIRKHMEGMQAVVAALLGQSVLMRG